jgi:fibronectin-binding autotransporter adhesin
MGRSYFENEGTAGLGKRTLQALLTTTAMSTAALVAGAAATSPAAAEDWIGVDATYETATNWNPNLAGGPDSAGETATFSGNGVTGITVTGAKNPDAWNFSGTVGYTLSGSAITFNAATGISNTATAGTQTINNQILGATGISQSGVGGALTLTNATNLFTGTITVSGGTLTGTTVGSLGSVLGSVVVSGGVLDLGGVIHTKAGLQLTGGTVQNGTFTSTSTFDMQAGTVSGVLAGAVGLNKTTAGTVSLTGANLYTGTTAVSAGTLSITGAGSIVSTTINITGGTLATDGGALAAGATVTVTGGTAVFELGNGIETVAGVTLAAGGTVQNGTLNAPITSTGGTVDDIAGSASLAANAGTTNLTGANTYTGTTTIAGGAIALGGNANAFSNASVTNVSAGGTLNLGGFAQSIATVNLNGAGATITNGALTGAITTSAGTIDNIGGTASVTTVAATTSLFSGTNTYSGATNVVAVSGIQASNANAFSLNSAHVINGSMNVAGFNQTIGSLAGTTAGAIVGSSVATASTLTTGGDNSTTSFAGTIQDVAAAPLSLTKVGTGTMTLTNAGNTYTGATLISAGGLTVSGAITASAVTNNATLTLLNGGDLGSTLTTGVGSTTTVTGAGGSTIGGLVLNSGAFTVDAGATLTATAGGITNTATGTMLNNGTISDVLNNAGFITNNGVWNANVASNTGTIINNTTWNGTVNNNGGIWVGTAGATAVTGAFANTGTVTMQDGATNDNLTVASYNAAGTGGTVNFDINLGPGGGTADVLSNNGAFDGTTTFSFNNIGAGTILHAPILVMSNAGATTGTAVAANLPPPVGLVQYSLQKQGNNWFVISAANLAAVGGVAGNIAIVQATLGAIVNRPSSPFVSGLAVEVEPGYCGPGIWTRGIGGAVNASSTSTAPGSMSATSAVGLRYAGAQFGLDLACFKLGEQEIDVSVGAIAGYNAGASVQAVPGAGNTNSTFQQGYGGIYTTVAKGQFSADLQARVDYTGFTFNNVNIQLANAPLNTLRATVSGSASYALPFGPEQDMVFVPTAGFSASRTTASLLTFTTGQTLQPNPSLSLVGFTGATVAKTFVQPDQVSAVQPFLTATVYNDFAPFPTALFIDPSSNQTRTVTSSHLGVIGEVSVGTSFFRIMEGAPKQLNATVRIDTRFSSVLLGAGITAQLRAQF